MREDDVFEREGKTRRKLAVKMGCGGDGMRDVPSVVGKG
jgi:hypothetical protein